MELVCVRHGRTAWNAERRFQGQTDIPLDDEGHEQARALGEHLRAERFDLAVTSDLTRARTTAGYICTGRTVALEAEPGLREMRFGVWEGLTWPEIVERWPTFAERHETNPRFYTPEGGESFDEVAERAGQVLARVTRRLGAGGKALVVSHAGVMHAIVRVLFGPDAQESNGLRFIPASVMRVSGAPGAWRLEAVNETADGRVPEPFR